VDNNKAMQDLQSKFPAVLPLAEAQCLLDDLLNMISTPAVIYNRMIVAAEVNRLQAIYDKQRVDWFRQALKDGIKR